MSPITTFSRKGLSLSGFNVQVNIVNMTTMVHAENVVVLTDGVELRNDSKALRAIL